MSTAADLWPLAQPESSWTAPRPDCPHPERWHATDPQSTEVQVTALVAAFVTALRPDVVVETGTFVGQTARAIGAALKAAAWGVLVTVEREPNRAEFARQACAGLPVNVVVGDSLDFLATRAEVWPGMVGFAWLDSDMDQRVRELELLRPLLAPGAVVGVHDTSPHQGMYGAHVEAAAGFSSIRLRTPRGVTFLQAKKD